MRRKTRDILTEERGASLIFVILALVIVSVIAMAIASLVRSNLSQAVQQEDDLKAYYLALSGQELAFTALTDNTNGAALKDDPHLPTLYDTLDSSDGLSGGTVDITVTPFTEDGAAWISITSVSHLDGSSATKTLELKFLVSTPDIQTKEAH